MAMFDRFSFVEEGIVRLIWSGDGRVAGAVSTETTVVQAGKRAVKFRPCIDIHKVCL